MRVTPKMAAAMKGTRMRELRAKGFTSDVFAAKYRGTCGCGCAGRYAVGDRLCYFEGFDKPIGAACANNIVTARELAAAPKCSCGLRIEYDDACLRCGFICETYFGESPRDVTRDTLPLTLEAIA